MKNNELVKNLKKITLVVLIGAIQVPSIAWSESEENTAGNCSSECTGENCKNACTGGSCEEGCSGEQPTTQEDHSKKSDGTEKSRKEFSDSRR